MPRRLIAVLVLALLLAGLPLRAALAACTSPAGVKGEFFYNDDYNTMQFCDGTNWVGMGGGGGSGTGVTDGDKGDITVSGSGASWLIDDDLLDFTEFKDALTLDASTDIAISGSNVLSLTNTGTGNTFLINDQASDTSPFVIAADGKVGVGLSVPTQSLDVVGKVTSDAFIAKALPSLPAPAGGSTPSAQWSTDGTHVWRATGNVGFGTATPGITLDVNGPMRTKPGSGGTLTLFETDGTRNNRLILGADATGGFVTGTYGTGGSSSIRFINTTVEAMRIDAAGNVGIGTTSPGYPLHVRRDSGIWEIIKVENQQASTGGAVIRFNTASTASNGWDAGITAGADAFVFRRNSGEVVRIAASGKLGIGTTTPDYLLHVGSASASGIVLKIQNSSGYCTMNPITTTWSCTSDLRLKKDVVDAGEALPWLADMRIRDFAMRSDGTKMTGVIAQEIQTNHPDMVHLNGDGYYTVDAPNPWKLVKAIQELKADNDNLRAEHDAELKSLRSEIEALKAAR